MWNGSSFGLNGSTATIVTTNTNLNGTSAGITYTLVVPKPSSTPVNGTLKIVGPCSGTAWSVKVLCPATLPSFTTNSVQSTFQGSCCATQNQTYYFARNASSSLTVDTNALPQVNNFVFSNSTGATALANGYYRLTSNTAIYVQNGVVSSISTGCSNCLTAYTSSLTARSEQACFTTVNQTYYHDGSGSYPVVNDVVYSDSAGTTFLSSGFRKLGNGGKYRVDFNGVVGQLFLC